jgi:hypothetical protein
MTQRSWLSCALLCGLLMLLVQLATAAEFTPAHIPVYCSPNGGATDAVVREVRRHTANPGAKAMSEYATGRAIRKHRQFHGRGKSHT